MELKNADIITLKNGDTCVVAGDVIVFGGAQEGVRYLDFMQDYDEITMRHKILPERDIVKIMRFDGFHEYKCVHKRFARIPELTSDKYDELVRTLENCIYYSTPDFQFSLIDKYLDLEVVNPDKLGFNGFVCTAGHFDSAVDNLSALEILQMGTHSKPLNDFTRFYWVHDGIVEYGDSLLGLLGEKIYYSLVGRAVKAIISKYEQVISKYEQVMCGILPEGHEFPYEFTIIVDFMREV